MEGLIPMAFIVVVKNRRTGGRVNNSNNNSYYDRHLSRNSYSGRCQLYRPLLLDAAASQLPDSSCCDDHEYRTSTEKLLHAGRKKAEKKKKTPAAEEDESPEIMPEEPGAERNRLRINLFKKFVANLKRKASSWRAKKEDYIDEDSKLRPLLSSYRT